MRKNNDGYVLPFVLVVMIVLCIMSASLMTAAFRNLQMQQKFTDRMVDKYAAQGEIEKIVAQLKQDIVVTERDSELMTPKELSEILRQTIGSVTQADQTVGEEKTIEAEKLFHFTVPLVATSGTTTIKCQLVLSAQYESARIAESSKYQYTIKVTDLTYQSYEVSTGGGT